MVDRDALGVSHESKDAEYHEPREHAGPAVYHRHYDCISENHNANIKVSMEPHLNDENTLKIYF